MPLEVLQNNIIVYSFRHSIILYIYYWKVHKSSTHKYLYTNTHKICGPKLCALLQPSLRLILKKEQRHWLPHNLKYGGKIRYRILHPFFFSHFLDAKATMCWLSEKRLTKCWLWDCFLLWVTFSTGKKLFTFFFQQKSFLRSFVKKSLKVFSYLKTSTFWSFWKKVRNECVLKKKSRNASDNVEKKVFSKLVESLSDIHMTHANTTIHF